MIQNIILISRKYIEHICTMTICMFNNAYNYQNHNPKDCKLSFLNYFFGFILNDGSSPWLLTGEQFLPCSRVRHTFWLVSYLSVRT